MAPPKKKRKPTRLVKSKKTTPAAQKLMDANATQSPLLRLSPELRNRIYRNVLGDRAIHIVLRSPEKKFVHSVCAASPSGSAPDGGDMKASFGGSSAHARCYTTLAWGETEHTDEQLPLNLNLLQVCKQIHEEAALLPFTLNTFMGRAADLAKFTDRLIAMQRSAVTSVILDSGGLPRGFGLAKTDKARLAKWTTIKSVTLLVCSLHEKGGQNVWPSVDELAEISQRLEKSFVCTSVTSVTVYVSHIVERGLAWDVMLTDTRLLPQAYMTWARETERKLLELWSNGGEGGNRSDLGSKDT